MQSEISVTARPTQLSNRIVDVVERLSNISAKAHVQPVSRISWPDSVETEQEWFTSPEFISLYGTPYYATLTESQCKHLSFLEAVNFYSMNINGEKPLVEGMANRIYESGYERIQDYLHCFIDEENKHMQYFGRFCLKYAGKIYRDSLKPLKALNEKYMEGEEDFLFFCKTVIFEELVDYFNKRMSKDERLNEVARAINLMHHEDEVRHLVFGHAVSAELFTLHSDKWGTAGRRKIRSYLKDYIDSVWREYYNPEVYRDLGLSEPHRVAEDAFNHPAAKENRKKLTELALKKLYDNGILLRQDDASEEGFVLEFLNVTRVD